MAVCPHYTHTDRTVGSITTHVCRDCTSRIEDCEHLTESLAASFAPVLEQAFELGILEERADPEEIVASGVIAVRLEEQAGETVLVETVAALEFDPATVDGEMADAVDAAGVADAVASAGEVVAGAEGDGI